MLLQNPLGSLRPPFPSTRDEVFGVEGKIRERKSDTFQIPQIFKMLTHSLVMHKVLMPMVNPPGIQRLRETMANLQ